MSATAIEAPAYAELSAPATLMLRRTLPGPVEKVWSYLIDSDLRAQWLAAGVIDPRPGAAFELVWRNDTLSASAAERPEGFAEESRATCTVTEVEVLRKLSFHWPNVGDVSFTLHPTGNGEVLLTLTHRKLVDRKMASLVGAGWHMHCDILAARLHGTRPASFWSGWAALREEYDSRLPDDIQH